MTPHCHFLEKLFCSYAPNEAWQLTNRSKRLALTNALGLLTYRDLFVNLPTDVSPSKLLRHLAAVGVGLELCLGPLCIFAPSLGVPVAILFHVYILSMCPFASVMEWNATCIYFLW